MLTAIQCIGGGAGIAVRGHRVLLLGPSLAAPPVYGLNSKKFLYNAYNKGLGNTGLLQTAGLRNGWPL
jgi:hypothetical protein